jgi:branched-chain amino acid transport system substrate-binding protein
VLGFLVGTPVAYEFNKYRFVLRPSYTQETERHITRLWEHDGVRKFAVVYQNDAFGAAVREATGKALQRYKSAPVAEASYSRELNDVQRALQILLPTKPEVVITAASSYAIKPLVDFRNEKKWPAMFLTFSSQDDAVIKCGKAANDLLVSQVMPPMQSAGTLPAVAQYLKVVKKYYPNDMTNMAGCEAYLNALVMVEGIKRAGKDLTRTNFVHALESIHDFDLGAGPTHKVNFSNHNHLGWSDSAIQLSLDHEGELVPVTDAEIGALLKKARSQ